MLSRRKRTGAQWAGNRPEICAKSIPELWASGSGTQGVAGQRKIGLWRIVVSPQVTGCARAEEPEPNQKKLLIEPSHPSLAPSTRSADEGGAARPHGWPRRGLP